MFASFSKYLPITVAIAVIAGVAHPAHAQLEPMAPPPKGETAGAPAGTPPPPVNPDPRNFSGSWKPMVPFGPNGLEGAAFVAPDITLRRQCIPDFAPYSSIEGAPQFVQKGNLLLIIFTEWHRIRRIRINGTHPANLAPSHWGDSIGHWDGDTLVVETTAAKGQLETNGPMVSPKMVMTERFRKIEGNTILEDQISFADPAGEKLPPPTTVRLRWTQPEQILEWICEDNGQGYWDPNKK